jgi:hypothetical protein
MNHNFQVGTAGFKPDAPRVSRRTRQRARSRGGRTASRRSLLTGTGYRKVRRPACPPAENVLEIGNGAIFPRGKETQAGSARNDIKARRVDIFVRRSNVKENHPARFSALAGGRGCQAWPAG